MNNDKSNEILGERIFRFYIAETDRRIYKYFRLHKELLENEEYRLAYEESRAREIKRHYELFKLWAAGHREELYSILGDRYIMYGEWMYSKHRVYYNRLPHYFIEFDIFDKDCNEFLDTGRRNAMLSGSSIVSAPVIALGLDPEVMLDETDKTCLVEGLYIKLEERGRVTGRLKYVRAGYTQARAISDGDWSNRKIIENGLADGLDFFEA